MKTDQRIIILDGATGTMLQKAGMPRGACTERYILENPSRITDLGEMYVNAGSDALLAPTFGANKPALLRHGYSESEIDSVCASLAGISVSAFGDKVSVGGDMSPTGLLMKPYGSTDPDEIADIYERQARVLCDSGVDFIFAETMISGAEAYQAARAVRRVSRDIPLYVSLTLDKAGKTLNGDSLEAILLILSKFSLSGFGCNCSTGPEDVYNALRKAAPLAKKLGVPLIAKPNAGLPIINGDSITYPMTPDEFASYAKRFIRIGATVLGGCCGTTPEHIAALRAAVDSVDETEIGCDAGECDIDPESCVADMRHIEKIDADAEYVKITDQDSLDEAIDESDDVLYLELGEGGAELVLESGAFITVPLALRGNESGIARVENETARKCR